VITRIATIISVTNVETELALLPFEKTFDTALCSGANITEKTRAKSNDVRYGKNITIVKTITATSITIKK
jgi:hypothetical protein